MGYISNPRRGITPTGTKQITQNGTYIVNVPNTYTASDEGKVVSNGALVAQTARAAEITQNGTYDTTLNDEVTVNVSGGGGGGGAAVDSTKMYYNGYLLPKIPVVSGYDYVWIRKNEQTGYFDALYGKSVWYADRSDPGVVLDNWYLKTASMPDYKWYRVPIQDASSSTWAENTGTSYSSMGTENNRDVIWTSHDILDDANGNVLLKHGSPVEVYIPGTGVVSVPLNIRAQAFISGGSTVSWENTNWPSYQQFWIDLAPFAGRSITINNTGDRNFYGFTSSAPQDGMQLNNPRADSGGALTVQYTGGSNRYLVYDFSTVVAGGMVTVTVS